MDRLFHEKLINELKYFLITGSLGKLSRQPTINEVEKLLGKPIAVEKKLNVVPDGELLVFYYENLQLTYIGNEFYQVALYFREYAELKTSNKLPDGLAVGWYDIAKRLNYKDFKQFLASQNIPYREVLPYYPTSEDGYTIEITPTGIMLVFNDEPSAMIDSIFYTPSRPGEWKYAEHA